MLLHALDCCKVGHKEIMIKTVDTDVLVIAVTLFEQIGAEELWLEFGAGKEDEQWQPLWTTLTELSKDCSLLIKCGCNPQKGCKSHCSCVKADLPCTAMCKCNGDCERC